MSKFRSRVSELFKDLDKNKPVENFSVSEALKSNTGLKNEIEEQFFVDRNIIDAISENLVYAQMFRNEMGVPIRISSGYRCQRLNKIIGGATKSDHLYKNGSGALDLQTNHPNYGWLVTPNQKLFEKIIELYNSGILRGFRQLIHEFGSDNKPAWVHFSTNKKDNKNQILDIKMGRGYEDITSRYISGKGVIDDDLLHKATEKWGVDSQIHKIQEEILELALAINQSANQSVCVTKDKEQLIQQVVNEIADCKIMIRQAELIYGISKIDAAVSVAINKLKKHLER